MKRLTAIFVFLLLMASAAFALSDAEYKKMRKNSASFARADKRLTQVWNRLKKSTPKKDFAKLQALQREWIKSGRDEAAQEYIDEGYTKVEAYTMATKDRADDLPDIAKNLSKSKTQPKSKPKSKPEPKVEVKEFNDDENDDDNYGEIEEDRFKNQEPGDVSGNYSRHNKSHGGFMTVLVTDKENNEVSVTISLENPQVTWSASGWLGENNLLELFDKDYPSCQANLTFSNNKIEIETSDSDDWNEVLGEARLDGTYTKE